MQIAPHLIKIINLISSNPVVSVVASTGSGKSVGVPAGIAANGARCFVTVPTRTAAISLAEYQRVLQRASSPEIDVKKFVGYAAEGNINYGPETKIAYVTGGHARRKMLSYFSNGSVSPMDFCDVLMVDEIHSGSLDSTMIVSLWMKAAVSGVLVPRLVIASATPAPIIINPEPVVYTVNIPSFPIDFVYLNKDIELDDPSGLMYHEAAKIASDIHLTSPINSGHILIFAPGSSEVETINSSLRELLQGQGDGKIATIISAFGALKPEDIALIYKVTAENERKIVIATNIAEMSITITDIGYVVDTMGEKRAETSQSGGFRLSTHFISKDSATQRAGRTGRTRPGTCYRLITEEHYKTLEEHRPPEIDRIPIYEPVIELLDVGLSPETVIQGIDPQRILQAVDLLTRLGMVTTTTKGIVVNDMGHFAPKFPISVRNAAFLWNWIQSGHPIFPGIVTACLIDSYGPSYFWVPRRKQDETPADYNFILKDYKEKYFSKYIGYNDLETSLNMWNDLMVNMGGIRPNQRTLIKWSRENSINNKKIKELLTVVEKCVNTASREGYQVQIGPFTTQGVMNASRPILLTAYSDMIMSHVRDTTYLSIKGKENYRLDTRDSVNKFEENYPKGVISLSNAEIKTQRGTFRIIGFAVDIDKDARGRPIIEKHQGPRAVTRTRQPPAVKPQSQVNIKSALDLLQDLKLEALDVPMFQPADALDLLNTLVPVILPVADIPPTIAPIIVPQVPATITTTTSLPQRVPTTLPQRVPTTQQQRVPTTQQQRVPTTQQQRVPTTPIQQGKSTLPQRVPATLPQRVPATLPQRVPATLPQRVPTTLPQRVPATPIQQGKSEIPQYRTLPPVVPVPQLSTTPPNTNMPTAVPHLLATTPKPVVNITLLPLSQATDQEVDNLGVIARNPRVSSSVGEKNTRQLRDFAKEDLAKGNREYLHWIILNNGVVVGYVGIHPTISEEYPGSQIRYFIDPKYAGQGIATNAVELMVQTIKSEDIQHGVNNRKILWSFIDAKNIPSIRVAEKTGFLYQGQKIFRGITLNVYSREI